MEDRTARQYKDGYRICSIEGCDNKHTARNLCRKHYNQQPDVKAKLDEYRKEYFNREDIKEKSKEYHKQYRAEHKAQVTASRKKWRAKQKTKS